MKKQTGFTLIELLVVIAIIGILASVVLLALNSARAKSRDAKRLADMNQMAKALELYFNENNNYPTSAVSIAGGLLNETNAPGLVPKFLAQIPQAPTPADGSCTGGSGINNNNYWYQAPLTGNVYTVTFCLGDNVGGDGGIQSGARSLTPGGFQ